LTACTLARGVASGLRRKPLAEDRQAATGGDADKCSHDVASSVAGQDVLRVADAPERVTDLFGRAARRAGRPLWEERFV